MDPWRLLKYKQTIRDTVNALQVTMMVNKHYYNRKEKQKIAETIIITTEEFIEIKPKVLKKKMLLLRKL